MAKIDTICRRLRDIGIFFIGLAALSSSVCLIVAHIHSPEREKQRAMLRAIEQVK